MFIQNTVLFILRRCSSKTSKNSLMQEALILPLNHENRYDMKNSILTSLILCSASAFGQARLVINNDAFINIQNGAKVVIDNNNTNAITLAGTGGNIRTEAETNQLWWKAGAAVGTYVVPFVNAGTVKIPVTVTSTVAGSANGFIKFSTWETTDAADLNFPRPSDVASMGEAFVSGSPENSLNVIDRFWVVDVNSYTTTPALNYIFTYNDLGNELNGFNTIVESNLRAQRWDPTGGGFDGLLFGTTTVASNSTAVSGVQTAGSNFRSWTLTSSLNPLPVTMVDMAVSTSECSNNIMWMTGSETNADRFVIESSSNNVEWKVIGSVNATGGNQTTNYRFSDSEFGSNGTTYYRISLIDNDGSKTVYNELACTGYCSNNANPIIYPNPFSNEVNIMAPNAGTMSIFDGAGKLVQQINIVEGKQVIQITDFSIGMYSFVTVDAKGKTWTNKLIKR
jgi:Secretion system C-terminal sorting domain